MEFTVARTPSGSSCMYTSVVVAVRECRIMPCTSFTVPFFWASVAMVRRITWNVNFGSSNSSASLCKTR